MSDPNNRIRLSWAQIAWGIGMFLLVASAWADMRVQLSEVKSSVEGMKGELAIRVAKADREHDSYDRRLDRLEARRLR